jgi:predicted nucleic acid-binding protein
VPRPVATIDTSVLVSLQHAGLLAALSVQFERVLVPVKVRSELRQGGERNEAALKALVDYSLFENCDDYDPALVRLLLDSRSLSREGRDEGEAEAVVQASQRGVKLVLTDDALGRKWAATHSLDCHGTIWVCVELRRTGYLMHLRPYFIRLIQSGRHMPLKEMNRFLVEFSETEIAVEDYNRLISGR